MRQEQVIAPQVEVGALDYFYQGFQSFQQTFGMFKDAYEKDAYRQMAKIEDQKAKDIVMSHSSVNFDKSGFVEDINVVFPLDRIHELAQSKKIGSVADVHYSFMGAGLEPEAFEQTAAQVAGLLKQDQVDAVLLTPV